MFSRKNIQRVFILAILSLPVFSYVAQAEETGMADVSAASLPINVSNQESSNTALEKNSASEALVSPSDAKSVAPKGENVEALTKEASAPVEAEAKNNEVKANPEISDRAVAPQEAVETKNTVEAKPVMESKTTTEKKDDFNFDLKMKTVNSAPEASQQPASTANGNASAQNKIVINEADLPKEIQYQANSVENLGNSVLSQMDSDLFTQMSDIEKSTTLLTLELRREKLRNEIEAQKAIRRKTADDFERQKKEEELRFQEKQKQIEAQVIKERQLLVDKEKIFESLKQRKLLNAYMNQMLLDKQEWLKEKEALYEKLAQAEVERHELIELFKQKIDKVLEASAKNIQTAEAAKANFERIVKGLKTRNEQLRKRIEADAQIIKNAKNTLYLKSQSIEELKDKNAALANATSQPVPSIAALGGEVSDEENEVEETPQKLSSEYAILGITGRAGVMSVDVIDIKGQPLSLKVGSPLPTGHVVSEIGSDYAKFSRDGRDDYLYVGKTIDGIVPTLGLTKDKN